MAGCECTHIEGVKIDWISGPKSIYYMLPNPEGHSCSTDIYVSIAEGRVKGEGVQHDALDQYDMI